MKHDWKFIVVSVYEKPRGVEFCIEMCFYQNENKIV